MTSKTTRILLLLSVFVFLGLIGLAVYMESTYMLYAASAVPLFIVPVLPDIRGSQFIRSGKQGKQASVSITGTTDESGTGRITIAFSPGYVAWHKRRLYFNTDDIMPALAAPGAEANAVSAPVLRFDLIAHPRKQGWVGIQLANLVQRTQGVSYTTDEISRLILNASDVEEIARRLPAKAASHNRGVEA